MTRSLSSASVIALSTRGSEIGQTVQSTMSKYSTASKLGFAGTLTLRLFHCDVQLWPSSPVAGPALECVVDGPSSWQILRVSDVRVAVKDWVNDPLVLRAEVSTLDEHLVKVPSSVFA